MRPDAEVELAAGSLPEPRGAPVIAREDGVLAQDGLETLERNRVPELPNEISAPGRSRSGSRGHGGL